MSKLAETTQLMKHYFPLLKKGRLKDSTTNDLRSLIQKICLGEAEWVSRINRGSSSFSSGGSRWEALIEHYLNNYHIERNVMGMAEALDGSVGNFDKHQVMVAEEISRWCPNTNTFLCQLVS